MPKVRQPTDTTIDPPSPSLAELAAAGRELRTRRIRECHDTGTDWSEGGDGTLSPAELDALLNEQFGPLGGVR